MGRLFQPPSAITKVVPRLTSQSSVNHCQGSNRKLCQDHFLGGTVGIRTEFSFGSGPNPISLNLHHSQTSPSET
jgi:hypothetical protein